MEWLFKFIKNISKVKNFKLYKTSIITFVGKFECAAEIYCFINLLKDFLEQKVKLNKIETSILNGLRNPFLMIELKYFGYLFNNYIHNFLSLIRQLNSELHIPLSEPFFQLV